MFRSGHAGYVGDRWLVIGHGRSDKETVAILAGWDSFQRTGQREPDHHIET